MKSFESVYKELENLFINKLPEYVDKINKEHNDGVILKPFRNTSLEENCIKIPSFIFNIEESGYSEKDRIIENSIFTISLNLKLQTNLELNRIIFFRYIEVIQLIIRENNIWSDCRITNVNETKIIIRITV